MDNDVTMKSEAKVLLPAEIQPPLGTPIASVSMEQAVAEGLIIPARVADGAVIPAVPAGMGVFAKTAIQVKDANGDFVAFPDPVTGKMVDKFEAPCHSFTRQFGLWVRGMFQNTGATLNTNETLTDDTGASYLPRIKGAGLSGTVSVVSGLAKIKFGNSSTALSTTQTNLVGTLLGPTTEAAVTVSLTVEDSTNTIFTVSGQITNGTGGSFTVQEMGIFAELTDSAATANRTTMMLRDLTGSVVVNNGQTIIGTYTFTISV